MLAPVSDRARRLVLSRRRGSAGREVCARIGGVPSRRPEWCSDSRGRAVRAWVPSRRRGVAGCAAREHDHFQDLAGVYNAAVLLAAKRSWCRSQRSERLERNWRSQIPDTKLERLAPNKRVNPAGEASLLAARSWLYSRRKSRRPRVTRSR